MTNKKQRKRRRLKKSVRVALGVGIVTIVAGIGTFKGCKEYKRNNEFVRIINEDGNYELDGFIIYDNLKEYSVVETINEIGEREIYIAKGRKYYQKRILHCSYKDIYSNKIIGVDTNLLVNDTVVSTKKIDDYLIAYDMIKEKYSSYDIELLLDKIEEDYERYETEMLKYKIYQ